MTTNDQPTTRPRPVGVVHLVFGLIFSGIAALWFIGYAADADYPDLAKGIPVVLIGAGLVGLGASAVNHRRARTRLAATEPPDQDALRDGAGAPPQDPSEPEATDHTAQTQIIEKDES